MAIVGVLTTILSGNNAPLLATLASSGVAMRGYAAGTVTSSALANKALLGVGVAAVAGMAVGINAAGDFESQLNTINTIARQTPEALQGIGQEIRQLSVESGADLPDLTASFYDLLSVGVPLGNTMKVLGNAVNLSLGGLGTVNEAATAITGSINAWSIAQGSANLTLADTARVTDILAKGIELGDIKARDLPAALANIAPQAANFNVSLEEVVASLALMSTKFISPAEGATAMNAAFTALQRVPPGMQTLQDATGKAYEQIARTEGAHSAMMQLVADAKEFNVNLVDVFGRVDALPYVLQTTGAAAGQFGVFLGQALDPYGTAIEQANERTKGWNFAVDVLGASLGSLAITLGSGPLPTTTEFVMMVGQAVQGATAWAEANPVLAASILPVVAGIGALALGVTAVTMAIGLLGLILSPIGLLLAGIALAVALVVTHMEELKAGIDVVSTAWAKFQSEFGLGPAPAPEYGPGGIGAGGLNPVERGANPFRGIEMILGGAGAAVGGLGDQIFRGGRPEGAPIQLNNTTVINVDGQKFTELNDRRLYNNASQASSGFNRGALE